MVFKMAGRFSKDGREVHVSFRMAGRCNSFLGWPAGFFRMAGRLFQDGREVHVFSGWPDGNYDFLFGFPVCSSGTGPGVAQCGVV